MAASRIRRPRMSAGAAGEKAPAPHFQRTTPTGDSLKSNKSAGTLQTGPSSAPVLGPRYKPHCLLREYLASLRTPVTGAIGVLWPLDPKICIHQRITGIGRW